MQLKREIFGSQKCDSEEGSSHFSDKKGGKPKSEAREPRVWHKPFNVEVRVIDFGGATY